MPGAVANAGLAHKVLPLQAIAWEITRLVRRPQAQAGALRETVA
jgi:chemotaxis response regulator CheB